MVRESSWVAKEKLSGVEVLIRTVAQILRHGTEIAGDPHRDLHPQVCVSYLTKVRNFEVILSMFRV